MTFAQLVPPVNAPSHHCIPTKEFIQFVPCPGSHWNITTWNWLTITSGNITVVPV